MVKFIKPMQTNEGREYWFNPVTKIIMETTGKPDHGFTSEIDATPVYDSTIYNTNLRLITSAKHEGNLNTNLIDSLANPALEPELEQAIAEHASLLSKGRFKEAALLSTDNPVVNIVKIESHLYGRKDRRYAGRELARTIPTEELITNIDKLIKMGGYEEIREGQLPRGKDIKYERVNLETRKYGLTIRITDEATRKNIHNPYEDAIQVASTKEAQRKSYDVITELDAALDVIPGVTWDNFVAGTDRSENDPAIDILRVVQSTIEGTNIGGQFTHMGINGIGGKLYDNNSFNRGALAPADPTIFVPGTREAKNLPNVTMVSDQFIPQGDVYLIDASAEDAACVLLEGPTTVGTDVDLIKTRTYVALSYHLAKVINKDTGIKMTGVYTPLAPAT